MASVVFTSPKDPLEIVVSLLRLVNLYVNAAPEGKLPK